MINWSAFVVVVVVALVGASVLVTLFSTALRVGDGDAPWRRPVSVGLYVVCGLVVAFGLYLIIPALHAG
jgi:hypothetical protein